MSKRGQAMSDQPQQIPLLEMLRNAFGECWNNGTHARIYRPKLLEALKRLKEQGDGVL